MVNKYYQLLKPGIVRGNLVTALTGFLLAARGSVPFVLLVTTLCGIGAVIACACIINNYVDRNIDKAMTRTKNRALVTGEITPRSALTFAAILGFVGFWLLVSYTNIVTVLLGVLALLFYVVVYGVVKRRSEYGTLVGTIPGALPPVAGYTAVAGRFDLTALILFMILVFWQMAHFFAIAIYRKDEYVAAGIPLLPITRGIIPTIQQIVLFTLAFTITAPLLAFSAHLNRGYFIVALLLGAGWFAFSMTGFREKDKKKWAHRMFMISLVVLILLCLSIVINSFID